ncbi:MAG: hypothetical protein Q7T26_13100 [Dehalococcoidia bacterium]|nr:hypothetical protein [Dehalococcoidia bacterium]
MMHGHGDQPGGKPPSHWRRWGLLLALVAAAVAILVLKVDALTVLLVGGMLAMHLFMPHGAGHGAGQGQQSEEHHTEPTSEQGSCDAGADARKPTAEPAETGVKK